MGLQVLKPCKPFRLSKNIETLIIMKCPTCGSTEFIQYVDGSVHCKYCNTLIKPADQSFSGRANRSFDSLNQSIKKGKRNKIVAALLAIFLGCIGAQYFYYGQWGKAIVCVLFCWTYIPSIWGLIHGILLLTCSDEEFDKKYNN